MPVVFAAMGSVEAYNSLEITPLVSGQIEKLHFREGDDVARDAVLVTIDPTPFQEILRKAEAKLASDEVALRFQKDEAGRYAPLVEKGAVSRSDSERARTEAEVGEETVRADRAEVEQARLHLDYCTIRAPIAGRAGAYLVNQGAVVEANKTRLLVINQIMPLYVAFSVPERLLGEIRAAQKVAALAVEARIPGQSGESRRGRLAFIDNTVDPGSGMIALKGQFANEDAFLWPGQYVHATLVLGEQPDAIVVPVAAIQTGPKGAMVFVVKADGTVESRPVLVDRTQGQEAILTRGVVAGETVVTDGQNKLKNGTAVTVGSFPAQGGQPDATAPQAKAR
jgi:multidrug efflux system membrane fusion protein